MIDGKQRVIDTLEVQRVLATLELATTRNNFKEQSIGLILRNTFLLDQATKDIDEDVRSCASNTSAEQLQSLSISLLYYLHCIALLCISYCIILRRLTMSDHFYITSVSIINTEHIGIDVVWRQF